MKSRSVWLLVIGGILLVLGFIMMLAAPFEEGGAKPMLPYISAIFSFGALVCGLGFFVRGQEIEENARPARELAQARQELMRANGTCAICKKEPAMIRCNLHNTKICATCLASHDSAWCEYVPCGRKSTAVGKGAWR